MHHAPRTDVSSAPAPAPTPVFPGSPAASPGRADPRGIRVVQSVAEAPLLAERAYKGLVRTRGWPSGARNPARQRCWRG